MRTTPRAQSAVEEVVRSPSSGGADVKTAVGGGAGGEFVGDVDGVALPAVLGRRVPQPDVLTGVVARERHFTVSIDVGREECSVGEGGGDDPPVAVADRFTRGGEELPVVAASDDDITDVGAFPRPDRPGLVAEVAGVEAGAWMATLMAST